MVWGGIGANGTTSLHLCERNMVSEYYQHVLQEIYWPFHQSDFVIMQDNATLHTSESSMEFSDITTPKFWFGLRALPIAIQ